MSLATVKLSQILKLEYGKGLPEYDRDIDGTYAAYGANGVKSRTNKFLYDKPSIIVGRKGSAGELTLVKDKFWALDVTYYVTHDDKKTDLMYLYYALQTKNLTSYARGVKPGINRNDVYELEIPLPPLPIQQKIVAKLDAIFAEIDKATAAAEANAKNAEALFQSYLTEVFERGGEGWLDKIINDVCSNITDGKHGDCANQENSGYYFLSAKDIKNGILNYKNARQITQNDFEETHRRTNLEEGDVLVTNSGTIGRMAIATNQIETTRTTFQKSVAILKPIKKEIDNKFLFHLLTSKLIHFNNISAGAAQKNLLLRDIRSLKIKIPNSIDEQIKIAIRCDLVRNYSDEIKRCYLEKLDNINKLKNSILQQAFSGELVKD